MLPPGNYSIKIQREGFEESAEQVVSVKSGDSRPKPLAFSLAAIPKMGVLAVENAPANAEIFLDGVREGTVNSAGKFSKDIAPGVHSVSIRKPNYEELRDSREFKAGAEVKLSGSSMKAPGILNMKVLPVNAKILYWQGPPVKVQTAANNHSLELRAGVYQIRVEAERFLPHEETVQVISGNVRDIDWGLAAKPVDTTPVRIEAGDVFDNGSSWTTSGGWWVHSAKGLSPVRIREGTFTFDILNPKDSKDLVKSKIKRITFAADRSSPRRSDSLHHRSSQPGEEVIFRRKGCGWRSKERHGNG